VRDAYCQWQLPKQIGSDSYEQDGNDLQTLGLCFGMSLWQTTTNSRKKVKLPKRSEKGKYNDQAAIEDRKFVPERY
jgi:hypothetical protein